MNTYITETADLTLATKEGKGKRKKKHTFVIYTKLEVKKKNKEVRARVYIISIHPTILRENTIVQFHWVEAPMHQD